MHLVTLKLHRDSNSNKKVKLRFDLKAGRKKKSV